MHERGSVVAISRSIARYLPNDSSSKVDTGLPPPTPGMRLRATVLERAPVAGTKIERSDLNAHFCASLCNPAEFMAVIYLIIREFTCTIRKDQTILRTHAHWRARASGRARTCVSHIHTRMPDVNFAPVRSPLRSHRSFFTDAWMSSC